jgi:deoxyribodipyrimidine photo-lyase
LKTLVWLRNDLRLWDNPALYRAAETGSGVVVVYVLCEEYLTRHSIAPIRLDFIRRHLLMLAPQLADLNITFKVSLVAHSVEIPELLLKHAELEQCDQLFFNAEYPVDELQRDRAVTDLLRAHHLTVKRFHDRVIVPPGMIRNGQGDPYKVFTAFKRKWLQTVAPLSLQPLPGPQSQPEITSVDKSGNTALPFVEEQIVRLFSAYPMRDSADLWSAGEAEAHYRLQRFIACGLDNYDVRRDIPSVDGTSTLSPYLAVGAISPRQCLSAVLAANCGEWDSGNAGATCWIGEIIWREFYQHLVVDFPHVCRHRAMQAHTDSFPWQKNEALFKRWCTGRTGIPLVDAAMHQLAQTGWMHNRLRMVVAMFLTKNLQIDWRLGEQYFMSQLIDGDFAANNGGWQWSASTGADAAPYFRIFNPVSQSKRFDPDGKFIRQYVPELAHVSAKDIHLPPQTAGYLTPIVDLSSSRKHTIELFAQLSK